MQYGDDNELVVLNGAVGHVQGISSRKDFSTQFRTGAEPVGDLTAFGGDYPGYFFAMKSHERLISSRNAPSFTSASLPR